MNVMKKIKQILCRHDMHKIKEINIKAVNIDYGDNATVTKTKIYKCFYCGKIEFRRCEVKNNER